MMDGLKTSIGIAIYNFHPNDQVVILGVDIFQNLMLRIAIDLVRFCHTFH